MVTRSARQALPNSLILIEDSKGGEIPNSMNNSLVVATSSCIAIGGRSEDDGVTEVVLGSYSKVDPREPPIFEGWIETPSRELTVKTVLGATMLKMHVPTHETRLMIWVNDSFEPDHIIIGIM
jgi:hypothetical protein